MQKNGNLVECFDCHHIVSIHAQSCPNCGCPLSYTLEQYSRIAQEREAVQKRAEEGTKQEENEEINHRVEVESEDVFEDIVSEGIEAFVQDALSAGLAAIISFLYASAKAPCKIALSENRTTA